jgi:hypothetical protein
LDVALIEKRKYLKLVHVPIVMSVAQKAMEQYLSSNDFLKKLDAFFDESPDEYLTACMSGSSKRGNVQTRVKLMEEAVLGR